MGARRLTPLSPQIHPSLGLEGVLGKKGAGYARALLYQTTTVTGDESVVTDTAVIGHCILFK